MNGANRDFHSRPSRDCRTAGHVLQWANRPEKRNAFDTEMLDGLADAYGRLEDDPDAWVGYCSARDHFTGGLDLRRRPLGSWRRTPLQLTGRYRPVGRIGWQRSKPMVAAQGWCMTLGIELLLAADIRIAATDTASGRSRSPRHLPVRRCDAALPRTVRLG